MTKSTTPEGPLAWKQVALSDVAEFTNGKPYEHFVDVRGKNLLITLDSVDIYGQLKSQHKRTNVEDYSLKEGDIVTVLSDLAHGYLLGLSAQIPKVGCYVLNQRMGRLRTKESVNPAFLRLWLNAHQLHFRNRGQGTSQRHIYKRDFYSLEVSVPPLSEQQAIVDAVTDADNLVKSLDLLIAKKKDIKQGAMQQLLTGKTRLPGFSGEWKEVRLGDFATMSSGGTPSSKVKEYYGGNIKWASIADMTKSGKRLIETEEHLTDLGLANSSSAIYKTPIILYAMYASLGEVCICHEEVSSSQAILGIVPGNNLEIEFLYYLLLAYKPIVKTLGQQGTQSNLNKKMVQDFIFSLPPDQKEQTAIAEVLSDMDAEIDALVARREKTALIKTGMMQELLTGRTRLL